MDRMQDYIADSLEQHLFFARIMKEHAFFLKVGFLPPNADLAQEGEHFLRQFENLLSRAIALSNCVVRSCVLKSGEIFTEFTQEAERQTQRMTGTRLNHSLTIREMQLVGRACNDDFRVSRSLRSQVCQLNRDGLVLINGLIDYKQRLLDLVHSCRIFTVNYPLLIEHILREAQLYRANLRRLEGLDDCSCQDLRDSEPFWNRIMMEHAFFIRGLLDPTEADLICTADNFAQDYNRLLEATAAANDQTMCSCDTLDLTQKFRDFKQAGAEGIEACKIKSIILPLLADHVLREANHYIRLLEA